MQFRRHTLAGNRKIERHGASSSLLESDRMIFIPSYRRYTVSDSLIGPRMRYLIASTFTERANEAIGQRESDGRPTSDIYRGVAPRGEEKRPSSSSGYTDKFVSHGEGGGSVTSAASNQNLQPRCVSGRSAPCKRHDGYDKPGSRKVGYRYLESTVDVSRRAHQEATGWSADCCVIRAGTQDACPPLVDRLRLCF